MTGWYAERTPDRSAKAVIAVTLLALLLVAAVPVALLAGVVLMLLGHVVGGLALFGGSILAAAIAVAVAGLSGMRHLRKLVSGRSFPVVQLDGSQYTGVPEPRAATTPTSCSWTAASTPKSADLRVGHLLPLTCTPRGAGRSSATRWSGGQFGGLRRGWRRQAVGGVEQHLLQRAGQVAVPDQGRRGGQGVLLEADPDHAAGIGGAIAGRPGPLPVRWPGRSAPRRAGFPWRRRPGSRGSEQQERRVGELEPGIDRLHRRGPRIVGPGLRAARPVDDLRGQFIHADGADGGPPGARTGSTLGLDAGEVARIGQRHGIPQVPQFQSLRRPRPPPWAAAPVRPESRGGS